MGGQRSSLCTQERVYPVCLPNRLKIILQSVKVKKDGIAGSIYACVKKQATMAWLERNVRYGIQS